ncbi:MAG: YitT family protein [Lactobacillaceae bacterium]|jgi:uncharacterized membrane-anchored protein YitT (DUF2179 family)|nr:YitT family protein [Lactobacillaceae bacterium]
MIQTRTREIGLKILVFIISGALIAIAMNNFLIPNSIFSAGFNGVSQLLNLFFKAVFHINVEVGAISLAFNIPIAVIGWKYAGKQFTALSFLNSFVSAFLQIVMPKTTLVSHDPILAGLFGGILIGVAIGITFKLGFSTGGMDIISMAVQKRTGRSIGNINLMINGVIILIAGAFIGWQNAMYTIIGIYATSVAVDKIYTSHQKLTAFIVTRKADDVIRVLQADLIRGITVIDSVGAYTREESTTLMMVLSRYELINMQRLAKEVDPDAFINILNTVGVSNNFWNEELQAQIRRERLAAQVQIADALNNETEHDKL